MAGLANMSSSNNNIVELNTVKEDEPSSLDESLEFMNLINNIDESIKFLKGSVKNLLSKINNKEIVTAEGISLLEVKNQMMLSYVINIVFLILKKCNGKPIFEDPAIDRLIEIRTIIERIKPIENKLKYQIDKLIKLSATGIADKNDPRQFRANPDNLTAGNVGDSENSEDDTNDEDEEKGRKEKGDKKKSGPYVPPKLVAVHYDGDNDSSKKEKQMERLRKRALNSSIMQELGEEYLDTPVEVGQSVTYKQKQSKFAKDKQEYEETYFTRLPTSKKETHRSRSMMTSGNLSGLTTFEDISVLDANSEFTPAKRKRLSKQSGSKSGKKNKGFKHKKRRFH